MCALILRTGGTVLSRPLTDDAHRDSWNGWFGRVIELSGSGSIQLQR